MDAAIAAVTTPPAPAPRPVETATRIEPVAATPPLAADMSKKREGRLNAERSVELDAATDTLIYRLIDLTSGDVTAQTPSDARLKLRAYIYSIVAAEAPPAVEVRA